MTLNLPDILKRPAVALSGGKDSAGLLIALREVLGNEAKLFAFHIDHGQHGETVSAKERDIAANIADTANAHFESVTLTIEKDSSEDCMRQHRYRALSQLALKHQCDGICLGHHRMDLVETMLMNMLRGCDLKGLCSMPQHFTRDGIAYYRPALHLSPEQLGNYAIKNNLTVFHDHSNDSARYFRNRLRLELLPLLDELKPGSVDKLFDLSQSLKHSYEVIKSQSEALEEDFKPQQNDNGELIYPRSILKNESHAIALDLLQRSLFQLIGHADKLSRPLLLDLLEFIKSDQTGYFSKPLPGSWQVRARNNEIVLKKI